MTTIRFLRMGRGYSAKNAAAYGPRWCVTDAAGMRVFLAVREPSMVLVAALPKLDNIRRWTLPCGGAHGIDIDHSSGRLYVACDGGALVEVDTATGKATNEWPLAGVPDATFFNPSSGLVHIAIENPGLIQSIEPRTAESIEFATARGAKTTALVPPDQLYVSRPGTRAPWFCQERRGPLWRSFYGRPNGQIGDGRW